MLGSVIPSSRFLVNDLMAQVDWDRARVVVEYGPGVGTITQHILKRMVLPQGRDRAAGWKEYLGWVGGDL